MSEPSSVSSPDAPSHDHDPEPPLASPPQASRTDLPSASTSGCRPKSSRDPNVTPKPSLIFLSSPTPSDDKLGPPSPSSLPSELDTHHEQEEVSDPRPSALLAPVRGLRALARVCAGGGAVAYAAARRRRRLDGDPDVDGELGGSMGRDGLGWRSSRGSGGEAGHRVQVLVGGRVSPALSYHSTSFGADGPEDMPPSLRGPLRVRSSGSEGRSGEQGKGRRSLEWRSSMDRPSVDGSWRSSDSTECTAAGTGESCASDSSSMPRWSSVSGDAPSDIPSSQDPHEGKGFKWPWSAPVSAPAEDTADRPQPFAAEVAIKGWQVVGGRSFDDRAKVGAYVVYDIEIALRNGTTVSILRRYTEFVRLRDGLRKEFPHLRRTIPSLPGKNHMHKFSPEFLEERRPRLQRFLRTVMLHPEMGVGGDDSILARWVLGASSGGPAPPANGSRLGPTVGAGGGGALGLGGIGGLGGRLGSMLSPRREPGEQSAGA